MDGCVHERILRTYDDFVWPVDTSFIGCFIIDVEFLDLKICPLNMLIEEVQRLRAEQRRKLLNPKQQEVIKALAVRLHTISVRS
ncbi:hypothetical protein Ahy_B01g053262 [Arachis hypogaea]|uniref:Uncharacterized protein n=1 Tax=Arachis hypogaea TaxID=3818 RepID=A0A445ARJ4_ARAHY|nr:hypothetical protein Ahy_B01g053262 [Arachis hypogaea]